MSTASNGSYRPPNFTEPDLSQPITGESSPKRKANDSPEEIPQKRHKANNHDGRTSREDRCVYGNPKESIKSPASDVFDGAALDLSCKTPKSEPSPPPAPVDNTYHPYPRNQTYLPDAFPRSNLEIKLVNPPKRPSTTEQLQIAKLQQQQRRSVQQQQKMLQQMRRTLEGGGRPSSKAAEPQPPKDHSVTPPAFPHNPMQNHLPYMDTPGKDLPDGHPVLPLLDPVYFSALYNAHGFLPPSSPSIAAAFIGTLQDALPKLSMMFPPTSSAPSSSPYPQKSTENLP